MPKILQVFSCRFQQEPRRHVPASWPRRKNSYVRSKSSPPCSRPSAVSGRSRPPCTTRGRVAPDRRNPPNRASGGPAANGLLTTLAGAVSLKLEKSDHFLSRRIGLPPRIPPARGVTRSGSCSAGARFDPVRQTPSTITRRNAAGLLIRQPPGDTFEFRPALATPLNKPLRENPWPPRRWISPRP